ncbi:PIN domain-containing protein [Candidatus Bathyarchaeota archaeon]|nr:PIN domain-containing protein [Candidatus Bathyarchaeota archaeon]
MKLIVDTNILLKALIKDSKVRAVLLSPNHQLYIPEYALEEVERHMPTLVEKTGLTEEEIKLAISIIQTNMQVIPSESIQAKLNEANGIIGSIDRGDVPFVAAALSISCDGIESDDRDLKRQIRIRIWNSREIICLG